MFLLHAHRSAPYRTEEASTTISGRRRSWKSSCNATCECCTIAAATAHRLVPGVGRDLAEIVDRCLSVNPPSATRIRRP